LFDDKIDRGRIL